MSEERSDASLICPYTNKPAVNNIELPTFWCGICNLKLKSVYTAIQHLTGRSHTFKAKSTGVGSKIISDSRSNSRDFRCDVCDLQFDSPETTEKHLQGKRHAAKLKGKIEDCTNVAPFHPKLFSQNITSSRIGPVSQGSQNNQQAKVDESSHIGPVSQGSQNNKAKGQQAKVHESSRIGPVSQGSQNNNAEGQKAKVDESGTRPRCEVCNLEFNSAIVADNHYKGKRHAANLLLNRNVQTVSDNVALNTKNNDMNQAGSSKEHSANLLNGEQSTSNNKLSCEECKMSFNSSITASNHFNGKKHAATMAHMKNENIELSPGKRKHSVNIDNSVVENPNAEGSAVKKGKDELTPEEKIPCNECGVLLENQYAATQHFSGKRHAREVMRKEKATQRKIMESWQSGRDAGKRPNELHHPGRGRGRQFRGGIRYGMSPNQKFFGAGQNTNNFKASRLVNSNILIKRNIFPSIVKEQIDLSKVKHFDKGGQNLIVSPFAGQFTNMVPTFPRTIIPSPRYFPY